ncbi:MAG: hypothetical protein U0X93_05430 [Anaerolineales bacterium]
MTITELGCAPSDVSPTGLLDADQRSIAEQARNAADDLACRVLMRRNDDAEARRDRAQRFNA